MELELKTIIYAVIGGGIPALIWLWFWLREDKERPEPRGLLVLTFILGMIAVVFVLPLERLVNDTIMNETAAILGWATIEEFFKYLAVAAIALKSKALDEPIDYPIYFITAALGFAALENALFLFEPLSANNTIVSFINGDLRYLGATLLHSVTSGLIGIILGLVFYLNKARRIIYLICGLIAAIILHSIFNFFIIDGGGEKFFLVFGFLWVVTIIILLLFEKLRRMSGRLR